jgi:hypothetical protein
VQPVLAVLEGELPHRRRRLVHLGQAILLLLVQRSILLRVLGVKRGHRAPPSLSLACGAALPGAPPGDDPRHGVQPSLAVLDDQPMHCGCCLLLLGYLGHTGLMITA